MIFCLGTVVLCARTLAVLLVTGVQNKPGPGVEAENIMQIVCSECDRNLKSGGTQCDTWGRWFHNSCGSVKAHLAKSGKWISDKSRSKRLRLLEEKLQNALLQIDHLTRKNKALEEQLHWKNRYDWRVLSPVTETKPFVNRSH